MTFPLMTLTVSQKILAFTIYATVSLLRRTYNFKFFGLEERESAEKYHPKGSFAVALWHEYLFGAILGHAGQRFCPMTSPSFDGELVSYVMKKLKFKPIRGSTSRRGKEAREEIVEALRDGFYTALTVDGPKGPRRVVRGGIVDIAERAEVAIIPLGVAYSCAWVLKSWDQFKVPKPFSSIYIRYGKPIYLKDIVLSEENKSLKNLKELIFQSLLEAEAKAKEDLTNR